MGEVIMSALEEERRKAGYRWNPGWHLMPSGRDIRSACSLLCLPLFSLCLAVFLFIEVLGAALDQWVMISASRFLTSVSH